MGLNKMVREPNHEKIVDSKIQSFYNEQLKRDEDVLTFLDKREEKLEGSML